MASALAEGLVMEAPIGPFVVNDQGDVYVFNDLEAMYADIEAVDAIKMEIFDAVGKRIRVVVTGYEWHIEGYSTADPGPDRLMGILHVYFARLPAALAEFAVRAAAAPSLEELIRLRVELSAAPDPGTWNRFFKRSWG